MVSNAAGHWLLLSTRMAFAILVVATACLWALAAYADFDGGSCDHPADYCLKRSGRSLIVVVALGSAAVASIRPPGRSWVWLVLGGLSERDRPRWRVLTPIR